MGLQFPDQRRAFLGAAGRSHNLAAVVRPLDDPPQAFHNDIFIVNENYPIHRIRSFFFLPGRIESAECPDKSPSPRELLPQFRGFFHGKPTYSFLWMAVATAFSAVIWPVTTF